MMITVGSLFTPVLSLVNRNAFGRAVRQWDAEHGAKGFRCWGQSAAMVFQLAGADLAIWNTLSETRVLVKNFQKYSGLTDYLGQQ
jgi:hypothetical protein